MSDIKIFVSHRIDLDSETIDNPLYVNVRCGAVYDKRENVTMLGDDTGDNISEKRMSFCELTVQYWAWKNVKADYYGLCHYRRYLSFSKTKFPTNPYGLIVRKYLTEYEANEFSLVENVMRENIEKYDIITATPVDVRKISPDIKCIHDYCRLSNNDFNLEDIDILLDVIKELCPDYYDVAVKYYKQPYSRWYNCFIMKKEIFSNFCEWQFNILFELEKRLNMNNYSSQMLRELGFFGEHLYGIYCDYLIQKFDYHIKELQVVYFEDTQKTLQLKPFFKKNNIPVVFMSSDYYVPYLSVAIESLIQNASASNNYDIVILNKEISTYNKEILKGLCVSNKNVSLRFFNPASKIQNRRFYIASSTYAEEAYYRLFTPWILNLYDKAIVLDCDLVMKHDLAELLNISMSSTEYIAAVKDIVYQGMLNGMEPDLKTYCANEMNLKNPYNYVNTGVIVFNLAAVRNNFTEDKILDFASSHRFRIQEQDILNVIFEEHIHFLDLRWNYYVLVSECIKACISYAPADFSNLYRDTHCTPYIVHYANNPKPWNAPSVDLGFEWWHYARKSPYYEEILFRMSPIDGICGAVYDLQCRMNLFDPRSGARKLADRWLPYGSRRRSLAKKLFPRGSRRWRFLKGIYYTLCPKYKPQK